MVMKHNAAWYYGVKWWLSEDGLSFSTYEEAKERDKQTMMFLNDYQTAAARYRTKETPDIERVLGLGEEAGEVLGLIKKRIRGDNDPAFQEKVLKELGDTLWYLSQVAKDCGFSLQDVAMTNLQKLEDRFQRGVLKGSGDNR